MSDLLKSIIAAAQQVFSPPKAPPNLYVRETTLPSGVRLMTRCIPKEGYADIVVLVNAGAMDEISGNYPGGTAHFLEHMAFASSKNFEPAETTRILFKQGGDLDAGTEWDKTFFVAKNVPSESVSGTISAFSSMLCYPELKESEIELERSIIQAENAGALINRELQMYSSILETSFNYSAIEYPVIGTKQTISAVSRKDLFAFHKANYTAERTMIVIEGCVDHDRIVTQLNEEFCLPHGDNRKSVSLPEYTGGYTLRSEPDEATKIILAFNCKGQKDRNLRAAHGMLADILCYGPDSVLSNALRYGRGLVYRTDVVNVYSKDLLLLSFNVSPSHVNLCLQTIADELQKLRNNSPSDHLSEMKRISEVCRKRDGDGPKLGAIFIMESLRRYEGVLPRSDFFKDYLAVTAKDVSDAVERMLSYPPTLIAVGDVSQVPAYEKVCEMFSSNQPTRQSVVSPAALTAATRYSFPGG